MKKRKQILSTLLVIAMAGTLLTSCGGTEEGGDEGTGDNETNEEVNAENASDDSERISDEVITLTLAGSNGATAMDWNSTLQFEEYEKRLGIKFDATTYTNEQWSSRATLLFASDEMPDIMTMVTSTMSRADVQKYARDGYLLDFSQYLDIMPNLSKAMEENPDWAKTITFDDGGIYGFTYLNDYGVSGNYGYYMMSQAWLDNVGMEQPETLDELYQVLTAFKEQDANGNGDSTDEIPMAYSTDYYLSELPIRWAYGINGTDYVFSQRVDEDGNVGLWDTSENYKEFLRYMNRLYTEGLINEDAFIIEGSEITNLMNSNMVGYCGGAAVGGTREQQEQMGWYGVAGFTQDGYSTTKTASLSRDYTDSFRLIANADTEYPEEIAKFVDYLFTAEGSLSGTNGFEDITFKWIDVAGYKIADHAELAEEAGYASSEEYRQAMVATYAFRLYATAEGTIYDMLNNIDTAELTDLDGECWQATTVNAIRAAAIRADDVTIVDNFPILFYTDEETAERAILYTDIVNYLTTAKAQFITGEMDIDTSWDTYIDKLNEMGLERLLEIDQAAYDRYIAQ